MSRSDFDVQGFARGIHEVLVLSTLRHEAKHGYQIALDVESDSNGLFRFKHGTLYPILHRLEREGLIEGAWSKAEGRRKKVYALTVSGRGHLEGEADHVEQVLARLIHVVRGPEEAPA